MERHIVAMGGGGFSEGDPILDRYVLDLVDAPHPSVCFLGTASGDALTYEVKFYEAFVGYGCRPSVLRLFAREADDIHDVLAAHDVIYVGGGNTANLLAVWRLHGVDVALRAAWEAGTVLCGVSAGANCWFEASATDSFGTGRADPLRDGLGLLTGSFCPHYDSLPERRPVYRELVGGGRLPHGIGCDDGAAVHYVGTERHAAVASLPGAGAFLVERRGDEAVESPLEVIRLT